MNRLLPLFAMVLAAGCSKPPTPSAQIAAQYESDAVLIDLGAVGPAGWDRVCIFSPYSTARFHGRPTMGFDWDMDTLSSIGSSEGIGLLVFVQGQQVQAFADHPRRKGDFAHQGGRCFSREAAKFKRKSTPDGVVLEPVENAVPKAEPRQEAS